MSETAPEAQWPPLFSHRREEWVYACAGIVSLAGVTVNLFKGAYIAIPIAAGVLAFVYGICVYLARSERIRLRGVVNAAEADRVEDDWLFILEHRIRPLLLQVLKVVATQDPVDRKDRASSARTAVLNLASADVIGTSESAARLNLFRIYGEGDDIQMLPEPLCSAGRGARESKRIFTAVDDTTKVTLNGDSRFIGSVRDEMGDAEAELLEYDTFITSPVGVPGGQVWGVLTADCVESGQLSERRDDALMGVFATMIALTYACEVYPKPKRTVVT